MDRLDTLLEYFKEIEKESEDDLSKAMPRLIIEEIESAIENIDFGIKD